MFKVPIRGCSHQNFVRPISDRKTRMSVLSGDERISTISQVILMQYRFVTDRQTNCGSFLCLSDDDHHLCEFHTVLLHT